MRNLNLAGLQIGRTAAPLNQLVYLIDLSLVVSGDHEVINMITGYGTVDDCEGTLNFTVCTLESGIGQYEFEVHGQDIPLDDFEAPTIIALANNTAVNRTWDNAMGGHPSMLADFVAIAYTRWDASFVYFKPQTG